MVSPLNQNHRLHSFFYFRGRIRITQIIFLVLWSSAALATTYAQPSNPVRVAVLQDANSLRLKINGHYELINSKNNKSLCRGKNLNTTVTVYDNGILLGKIKANTNKLLVKTENQEAVVINGRRFRGDIQFIKNDSGRLYVINRIELEDYIKGILYHEVSHFWPMEVLKAQAVTCRTYAVYQMQENRLKDYDVTSDIYSQVYGGRTSERYRTNSAVDETRGQILTYRNKVFPAFFSATCGGHTEDASLLWNVDLPPLKGLVCGFCKDSPHFRWHYVLTLKETAEKLAKAGYKITNIKDIMILGRDNSGRITRLRILSEGKIVDISAKDFRNIMGPNIIRSTNFNVDVVKQDAVFVGLGWGHGVGLCQWGAYFLAKSGKAYEEILKYYYPGAEIEAVRF